MHILVTSPIPSHPQNHGNRARVYTLCKELQNRGHKIFFVYTGFEGLTNAQETSMRKTWDFVHVLSEKPNRRNPLFGHHHIDIWHPKSLNEIITDIFSKWEIHACIANYVWCSKWLEVIPSHIPKYIDTHDVFSHRHRRLRKSGIKPNWFSTSPRSEAKALRRASKIFAIQDGEAEIFSRLSQTPVDIVGHLLPKRYSNNNAKNSDALRLGYIGSDNPINQFSLQELANIFAKYPEVSKKTELHLAGPICNTDPARRFDNVVRRGFIEDTADFYQSLDIILNPHIGGTGLKIKSVEALSFGKPLIATREAMLGLPVFHSAHKIESIKEFCETVIHFINQPTGLQSLRAAGEKSFEQYQSLQTEALDRLFPSVGSNAI